jgi:hypothetical protein
MSTLSEIEAAVDQLQHAEKLRLMETLWAGLSRSEDWASPAWHGEALAETERRLAEGKEEVIEWEQAKKQLHQKIPLRAGVY